MGETDRRPPEPGAHAAPLIAVLEQVRGAIVALSDAQYTRAGVAGFEGSIGAHTRHVLDHFRALTEAVERGRVDYDRRQRGTDVETNRAAAIGVIDALVRSLSRLSDESLADPVELTMLLSPDAEPVTVGSTLGREVGYVLSHTIHHNAMIGAIAAQLGVAVPERFGYAPSTLAYQRQRSR